MKHWNWWLAWQVLRGRIRHISAERSLHDGQRITVELDNSTDHLLQFPESLKGKR